MKIHENQEKSAPVSRKAGLRGRFTFKKMTLGLRLLTMSIELTRNFSIIAHIDHGKTTLSDRLLETTATISQRQKQDQLLDSMDLERERGITIKSHPVTMKYLAKDGKTYQLNLADTPGHVDFSYEVSRSLAACEGALLLVDAAQGVEAQTVANMHLAHQAGLYVIPVINKIDLPSADIPAVRRQLEEILAIPSDEAIEASAKMGIGVVDILEAIVKRVPSPAKPTDQILRALVFDSVFDAYRGVVSYVRIFSGEVKRGTTIRMMATGQDLRGQGSGRFYAEAVAPRQAFPRGRRLPHREHEVVDRGEDRRHHYGHENFRDGTAPGV